MSIANVLLTPPRGYLMTDSLITWHDLATGTHSPLGFGTKFVAMPHLGCVVTYIGTTRFAAAMTDALNKGVFPNGLDSICLDGQAVFQRVAENLAEDDPDLASDGTIIIVGWSQHHERMHAVLMRNDVPTVAGMGDFTPFDLPADRPSFSPSFLVLDERLPGRKEAPEAFLKRVSLEQQRLFDERDGPWGCGGDMLLAEVTRHRIEVRKVGEFPGKAHAASLMKQAA